MSVTCVDTATFIARQLPPRLLSSVGLINSMDQPGPGESPMRGQGKLLP
jgi:hypothetical protein